MYDSFEPFQKLNIQEFNFKPNRYEIWKGGKKIDFGETTQIITNREKQTANGTVSVISFDDSNLYSELAKENDFDLFITSTDRLQLIKIPSSGNGDSNMGITMFKMTVGATRSHTHFSSNEPYCCNLFLEDGQIAKITFSFSTPDKMIEFYSDGESEDNELEFVFHSSDHIRYENGIRVSGPHGGAPRAIKVEPNITGGDGFTVTLFNTDGEQATVQMAPKQMKIQSANNEKIELVGYGTDQMGTSFSNYGLSIYHNQGKLTKCVLHMYDRNVDIEYLE